MFPTLHGCVSQHTLYFIFCRPKKPNNYHNILDQLYKLKPSHQISHCVDLLHFAGWWRFFCTFDVLSVEEKCIGLECRRKGLEESCPLHVGRTGGRWIEMDWRTARPSGPQVGGIHIFVLHHIVFFSSVINATMHFALYSNVGLGSSLREEPGLTTLRSQGCP